ncbi:hypothetical protein Dacet_1786 [Denitrovibrio acetiphilus DSM 12809]|jgi:hypothetical protein|uniref:Uncharacterized protein n=1 Tax=Denitrovibrio acetiphilus (strain DSM 12809 / NBRC 114555 / N2460) TaxID=522772 RepID=D4H0N7_DENA2|nr:hypothetical protein [Denitrovibrio acetiphilus]ADD68550.1 hypothetical protein Dacet_1786 [Denitrovibrio acetiphilus DSM 12809]
MEINMIPPVGPFKVNRSEGEEPKRKKYFHIKGKIETVREENGKYVIMVTSEEPSFKVEGIAGENVLLSSL